ncbi:DNA polymerase III subunit beta [Thermoanaerobacter sp. CM-CNRG TB177]|uniref:DNA polymerase III subunit beta n=1 Tax=Thermoanaerobacter sp. CM-CNRG TB177 TaxID=2800659 RepID=UPI001BDE9D1B|nr:DNA polymerase III subunit beta [Thermoanaerobacter sp. CM-CNRG TB177]MBT1278708.1 DNA polymerase III subunit beta [Thermoanaerobacter sp. CM-CNRG TB177]MDK2815250.1 polymerase subunit beta [Thermoanaerobacter sp.]
MKFVCDKNSLFEGVNIAIRGVSSRTTLPILQGIKITALKDQVKFSGTDLDIGIECQIPAMVEEEGEIVVPAKIFSELVRKLPEEDVKIESDSQNTVNVICDSINFTIAGSDAVEFPEIPQVSKENSFKLTKNILKDLIKKTVFCIAHEQTRPILTGVLFEVFPNEIKAVALDGFRMAIYTYQSEEKFFEEGIEKYSIVIPGKTLEEIYKILEDEETEIDIYHTANQVLFQIENTKVISRLLEGSFINYNAVLPKDYRTEVVVKREVLTESIERASLIAESKNNLIKFEIGDKFITVSSNSEKGKMVEKIEVNVKGMFLEIAFNSRYLLDSLRAIDEEEITLYFINSINPLIIKPIGSKDYLYMILPVKLN